MNLSTAIERTIYLRTVPVFGDLPTDKLAAIAAVAVPEELAAGTVVTRKGARVDAVRIVASGRLAVVDGSRTIKHLGAHDAIGAIEIFASTTIGSVVVVEASVVLRISADMLLDILEEDFDVALHTLRGLGKMILAHREELTGDVAEPNLSMLPVMSKQLDLVDLLTLLRKSGPFRSADVDGLAELSQRMRPETLRDGDVIWSEGGMADSFVVVAAGRVTGETSGKRFVFGPGDVVGFLEAVSDRDRWYTARAAGPVVVLRLRSEDLLDVLEDHFDMTMQCLGAFARRAITMLMARDKG